MGETAACRVSRLLSESAGTFRRPPAWVCQDFYGMRQYFPYFLRFSYESNSLCELSPIWLTYCINCHYNSGNVIN
ncbi:hypothetical protein CLOSTASPAR_03192 [[Clostridium] asparagiforme DSM 15981]|uniref:Uncharacterized protein n=1 Tax=[Clostridium] asparagiforme DSM 15981 TaxID=518636 RepID=C0D1Q3_9FIRM|nr:hypothetical protein CLOSTASPAR_03192 [[Clostridium] asparagiforme DSM 15981]